MFKLQTFTFYPNDNKPFNHIIREMQELNRANCDTWLNRVEKIEKILKCPQNLFYNLSSGKKSKAAQK